jgi:hypothetical protein
MLHKINAFSYVVTRSVIGTLCPRRLVFGALGMENWGPMSYILVSRINVEAETGITLALKVATLALVVVATLAMVVATLALMVATLALEITTPLAPTATFLAMEAMEAERLTPHAATRTIHRDLLVILHWYPLRVRM